MGLLHQVQLHSLHFYLSMSLSWRLYMMLHWTWKSCNTVDTLNSFPLGAYAEVEFLEHGVILFLLSLGTFMLSSLMSVPIYGLSSNVKGLLFLYTSYLFLLLLFVCSSHSTMWYLMMGLFDIFLILGMLHTHISHWCLLLRSMFPDLLLISKPCYLCYHYWIACIFYYFAYWSCISRMICR